VIGRFLWAMADNPAVTAHLNTSLVELIVHDGHVVGAGVECDGRRRAIRVRRGVLLAAGGFEQNDAMRSEFGVPGAALDTMGAPGNVGLAHRAAIAIGAKTDLMDQAWWSPGLVHPDGRAAFALCFTGGIFVDKAGRRFVNESSAYDRSGREIIRAIEDGSVGPRFWMVYDSRDGEQPPVMAPNVSFSPTSDYVAAGLWREADSLAELARQIDVPPDNLVDTVRRFNDFARDDDDQDFGRGRESFDRAFTGGGSPLVSIDTPPYRAAAFGLSDLGTKGGLRTDVHARVLGRDDRPIPGLYAAGNTMAAVSGTTYPGGGNPIGASLLFSHRAALHMAVEG
jgi:3-oxosteroid 1-dehydrogenase